MRALGSYAQPSIAARERAAEVQAGREAANAKVIEERERIARESREAERQRQAELRAAEAEHRENERRRLEGNLEHAQAALASCGGVDLSSEDAAIRSLDNMARRMAAAELVRKAKSAIEAWQRQQGLT